jgi:hypothetical protein
MMWSPLCSTAPLMRMLRGAFASGRSRGSPWHQSGDVSSQGDGKQVDSIACLTLRSVRRYHGMHEKTSLRTSAAPSQGGDSSFPVYRAVIHMLRISEASDIAVRNCSSGSEPVIVHTPTRLVGTKSNRLRPTVMAKIHVDWVMTAKGTRKRRAPRELATARADDRTA